MNCIFWHDGKRQCGSAWVEDDDCALDLAQALKRHGWKVVHTIHTATRVVPASGYEDALKEYEIKCLNE